MCLVCTDYLLGRLTATEAIMNLEERASINEKHDEKAIIKIIVETLAYNSEEDTN